MTRSARFAITRLHTRFFMNQRKYILLARRRETYEPVYTPVASPKAGR
jgi:hypothetical protein